MDGDRQKRVGVKESSEVDWLSNLPESLLWKVLLNLETKDVVRTSVLSKRWRNLWRYVPRLDLGHHDFRDDILLVSFVDAFLGFNSESYLESFKLQYNWRNEPEIGVFSRWINTVVDRRVKHLHVLDCWSWYPHMPINLYTCGSLVSLKLSGVTLASPMFVSLPCLKFMDFRIVRVANVLDLETLVSGCPILESLFIEKCFHDGTGVLRVCSQSLLRFTHISDDLRTWVNEGLVFEINAPRLQYLRISDNRIGYLILNNTNSLVEAHIDNCYYSKVDHYFDRNDLQKRKMIGSFLEGISCVKDVTITSKTLEVIYYYSKRQQLPLFCNLLSMRVSVPKFRWKILPIFLESCPNLKFVVVESDTYTAIWRHGILPGPRYLLSSLEFVEIEGPVRGVAMEMELVSYFLDNSPILKKLTVHLDDFMKKEKSETISKKFLAIPRLSTSCQVLIDID